MTHYKIEKGIPLFDELNSFHDKIREVKKPARELLKTIPNADIDHYYMNADIAGGISFVGFPKDKIPKDWCKSKSAQHGKNRIYCYPHGNRKSTKEIRKKMEALPRLNNHDLNKIIGFKPYYYEANRLSLSPGISWKEEVILVSVHDSKAENEGYSPIEGMTEILGSEYQELSKLPNGIIK